MPTLKSTEYKYVISPGGYPESLQTYLESLKHNPAVKAAILKRFDECVAVLDAYASGQDGKKITSNVRYVYLPGVGCRYISTRQEWSEYQVEEAALSPENLTSK